MPRAELTGGRLLTDWHPDAVVLVVLVLLAVGYGIGVRRRREHWPVSRSVLFLLGLLSIAVVTMSALGVYDRVLFWPVAVQNTVLLTLTPLLLGLGEPLALLPRRPSWGGPVTRLLAFPLVGALLCLTVTLVLYLTPLFRLSLTNDAVHQLVRLLLVAVGCLFCWPLMSERSVPGGYPLRMVFAFVDGLLDAIPGIIVMTGNGLVAGGYYGELHRGWGPTPRWDQTIGGGLMLTIAEATAIPLLVALFLRWARADERQARAGDGQRAQAAEVLGALTTKPWWEVDPGPLADRRTH